MDPYLKQFLLEKFPIEIIEIIEDKTRCPRWTTIQKNKLIITYNQIICWYDLLLAEIWWLYKRDKCIYKYLEIIIDNPVHDPDYEILESFINDLDMFPNQVVLSFTSVFGENP